MSTTQLRQTKRHVLWTFLFVLSFCFVFTGMALAQVDQGSINGTVKDTAGAVIPHALVTLTNTDTNFVLQDRTGANGQYSFSPIKIGHYTVSATAPKFETTTQENITVNIQDRLQVNLTLKPGAVTETVTVTSAPPLLQNESASVGEVMSTETINNTPLNGRNWIYIAQLTAGVAPALQGNGQARGAGTGDFSANGQRVTQNNFILDGVDNNVNVDDEQNGASYNVRPPPDALAEFKIDTADYSAEFGHSAGAVVNASIKSGTNHVHGDLWEYVRNTDFDAQDWDAGSIPAYHQNQFGLTLGGPIIKNKLFAFIDAEADRIDQASSGVYTVPSDTTRTGDFTEWFEPSLTGKKYPYGMYAPNTFGCIPLTTTGGAYANPEVPQTTALSGPVSAGPFGTVTCDGGYTTNVMAPGNPPLAGGLSTGQTDVVAKEILAAYPHANYNENTNSTCSSATPGGCPLYSNYRLNQPKKDDTIQWDARVDWNPTARDQGYARFSYTHEQFGFTPPLGPVIDGGNDVSDGFHGASDFNLGQNFMASETHIFNPNLINEFRFGYNWGFYGFLQSNANVPASTLISGLGGVPFAGLPEPNGGLPEMTFGGAGGISAAGARHDVPSIERQNIYQILDNVTKVWRSHSFKFGMQLETIRTSFSQAQYPRNLYQFFDSYTAEQGNGSSGSGMADAFTDNIGKTRISPGWNTSYYRWYKAFYAQDDWKVTSKLTANLGVRYDYIEPESSKPGDVANFQATSEGIDANGNAFGSGILQASTLVEGDNIFPPSYVSSLAGSNIDIEYINSKSLMHAQKDNFAPRVGLAYQIDPKTVVRAGFGMFFGAIELPGGAELTVNFPWSYTAIITNQFLGNYSCYPSTEAGASNTSSYCPSTGVPNTQANSLPGFIVTAPTPYPTSLEIGGSDYLSNGLSSYAGIPTINRMNYNMKTPYTMSYNLTFERQIGRNMTATLGYVGNVARHTWTITDFGGSQMVTNSDSSNQTAPFPGASGGFYPSDYIGEQMYNALQSKLQKRFSNGLSFLATYTWSRAMDNGANAGIGPGPGNYRNINIIPLKLEMTNAVFDNRHRVTLNGYYDLPFGKGRHWMHEGGVLDYLVGGWSTSLTFVAQTGNPFSVTPGGGNWSGANGGNIYAVRVGDPFKAGGLPPAGNLDSASCPASVKNRANWYNPCAFVDPQSGISQAQEIALGDTPYPQNGNGIPWIGNVPGGQSVPVTGVAAAISYLGAKQNQIYGPGYERVNMSLFKNFHTWRAQYLQFRADAFNLLNHPSWGQPGDTSLDTTAGVINGVQTFQNDTPDARFFQLSGKYVF